MTDSTKKIIYPKMFDGCRIENEQQVLEFTEDLILERNEYKQQLKEKDEEVERLKFFKRRYYEMLNEKQSNTKQVCEKIREKIRIKTYSFQEEVDVCFEGRGNTRVAKIISQCIKLKDLKEILNQIEKGESDD